jgi:hypothetical protein
MKIHVALEINTFKRGETFLSIFTETGTISSRVVRINIRFISAFITSAFWLGRSEAAAIVDGRCKVVGTGLASLKSNAKRLLEWLCTIYAKRLAVSTRGRSEREGEEEESKGMVSLGVEGDRISNRLRFRVRVVEVVPVAIIVSSSRKAEEDGRLV